jgi:hypothetical protein
VTVVLYRVDERLIHGQVVVGWGVRLRPDLLVVVDDELATSPWEQELYAMGVPDEMTAEFVPVDGAIERLPGWQANDEPRPGADPGHRHHAAHRRERPVKRGGNQHRGDPPRAGSDSRSTVRVPERAGEG